MAEGAAAPAYVNGFVNERGELVLLRRLPDGRLTAHIKPSEYALFVEKGALDAETERTLRGVDEVVGMRPEGKYVRIRARGHEERKKLLAFLDEQGVSHYEGDVHPARRFFSDTGATMQKPRVAYLDIETDSRVSFVDAKAGKARVLSWCVTGDDGRRFRGVLEGAATDTDDVLDANEARLLEAMWEALDPYDVVAAWNGDEFDFPVVEKRSHAMGARTKDRRRWAYLDHLALFERMNKNASESGDEKQSMALGNIAHAIGDGIEDPAKAEIKRLLMAGKEDTPPEVVARWGHQPLGRLTWDLWAAGGEFRALLLRYNVKDADLLALIEGETGYVQLFFTICELSRLFPDTLATNPVIYVDGLLLRLGVEQGIRFPTKKRDDGETPREKFAGAFVMEPKVRGIGKNVHVADFAAMYPSIILTWNMSPETKRLIAVNGPVEVDHCRAPATRVGFRNAPMGILPFALTEAIRLRKYWSKLQASLPPGTPEWHEAGRKSMAYKVFANSFYGVVGSPFSRYFDRQIAESTTQTGVWLIRQTIAAAEERGWTVVYCDTDSLYVVGPTQAEFEVFVEWCNVELFPRIIRETGCTANHIKIAYEKEFERIVFVSAKRYIGKFRHYKGQLARADSKPEVKGLEYKRGDCAALTRALQISAINLLMAGEEEPAALVPIVEAARDHVLAGELRVTEFVQSKSLSKEIPPDDPKKVRKNVEYYSSRKKNDGTPYPLPPHVAIAKAMRERGEEVHVGTRIEYYVRDGSTSPQTVAHISEYAGDVDRFFLWESQVWPATERLLSAAFPDHSWDGYSKVRPKKERAKKAKPEPEEAATAKAPLRRRKAAAEEQGSLFENSSSHAPPPTAPTTVLEAVPLAFTLQFADGAPPEAMALVKALLDRFAGPRAVWATVRTPDGYAVLQLHAGVADCPELRRELARIPHVTVAGAA